MLRNFSCFKVKDKKKPEHPDYHLSAKIDNEYVTIGAGWIKDSPNGKFISFKLSEPYGARDGFFLQLEKAPMQPEPSDAEKKKIVADEKVYGVNGKEIPF
jgi:uncharacterized protein (DUF736 family)